MGSVFYSLFLNETIYQYYDPNTKGTLISKSISKFQPLSNVYNHILSYYNNKFSEILLFDNNCLLNHNLTKHHINFIDILFGNENLNSYQSQVYYFFSIGIFNIIEFFLRIAFHYNLNLIYITNNHQFNSSICDNSIQGFEEAFISSYLLHNSDINFRNIGLINKDEYKKVLVIDYDNLGSNVFTGNVQQDITTLIEWSRLSLWNQDPVSMINSIKVLKSRIRNLDHNIIAKNITSALPEIQESEINAELLNIFKFRYINQKHAQKSSIVSYISNIINEVIPRQLDKIEYYYTQQKLVGESANELIGDV